MKYLGVIANPKDLVTKEYVDNALAQGVTFYRKYENFFETSTVPVSTIPIGITNYSSADMLFVDINGLDLIENTDFTVSGTNIVLTTPINLSGQSVHFTVLRAVNASVQDYSILKGDAGVVDAYPRSGATPLSANWLSETNGGSALTPEANQIYILMADSGEYTANAMFRWNSTVYEPLTSGSDDGGHVELTQAEYNALSQAEKENGDVYFITDSPPMPSALLDLFYPVGSYYETSNTNFNPNTAWGGTWELETEGQVHVSAGETYEIEGALTNTSDGGAKTVTLTSSQCYSRARVYLTKSTETITAKGITVGGSYKVPTIPSSSTAEWKYASASSASAHNNMQPYIVVNRWHRTA